MEIKFEPPYDNINDVICDINNNKNVLISDHMCGFDSDYKNLILENINSQCTTNNAIIWYTQILDNNVKSKYRNLNLKFRFTDGLYTKIWKPFENYNIHPNINFKNFICSFNGSPHTSRKLLAAILHKFGYFEPEYCSKNFSHTSNILDGHISDYVANHDQFYRKFFIADNSDTFFDTIYSFGHIRFDHANNIYNLENKLTESFLHIVSETMATSYYPFVTEKFLYSVVTRGLFLAYAQPGWHTHLEKYYGFKKYTKLFDYHFDTIQNPIKRLVELMSMISKFSVLSKDDWRDLYEIEKDAIEYNYNHYFSGDYLEQLKKYV